MTDPTKPDTKLMAMLNGAIQQREATANGLLEMVGDNAVLLERIEALKQICADTRTIAEKALDLLKDDPSADELRKQLG